MMLTEYTTYCFYPYLCNVERDKPRFTHLTEGHRDIKTEIND
nr:MAG TPA: hypothetical protein [Caudoviricetes sp.]